jgi:methylmalonyl-CoA mutase
MAAGSADARAAYEEWRALVAAGLKGRSFSELRSRTSDGIPVEALYLPRTDRTPMRLREARPWIFVQRVDHPDPEVANAQALADVAGGATGLSLVFAGAPSAGGHGLPPIRGALETVLRGIKLDGLVLRIEPHLKGRASVDWFLTAAERQGYDPARLDVAFGLDGLGSFARWGSFPIEPPALEDHIASTTAEIVGRGVEAPFVECDGRPYHDAGATEAQELGIVLATAVFYLRAMQKSGAPLERLGGALGFTLAIDQDQFLGIAKLRALRLLWMRVQEASTLPRQPIRIHAETSRRMMMLASPETNLVRTTIAGFAAALGGTDSLAILPFTIARELPDPAARKLALDLHYLLAGEAQIFRIDDPGAGSGLVEALTESLAERAWAEFQRIETEGGIWRALVGGNIQDRIGAAAAARVSGELAGKSVFVGATVYRDPDEGSAARTPSPPADAPQAPLGAARCQALEPVVLERHLREPA